MYRCSRFSSSATRRLSTVSSASATLGPGVCIVPIARLNMVGAGVAMMLGGGTRGGGIPGVMGGGMRCSEPGVRPPTMAMCICCCCSCSATMRATVSRRASHSARTTASSFSALASFAIAAGFSLKWKILVVVGLYSPRPTLASSAAISFAALSLARRSSSTSVLSSCTTCCACEVASLSPDAAAVTDRSSPSSSPTLTCAALSDCSSSRSRRSGAAGVADGVLFADSVSYDLITRFRLSFSLFSSSTRAVALAAAAAPADGLAAQHPSHRRRLITAQRRPRRQAGGVTFQDRRLGIRAERG
mmetsp:Transcript_7176/g.31600  ORF Transcript_7176/g.31600 Transcript_7176/m.31600 type:complete len:302 (-) Transcript_7176:1562-2467(-)